MNNRHNPLRHLDLVSQHIVMQAPVWLWRTLRAPLVADVSNALYDYWARKRYRRLYCPGNMCRMDADPFFVPPDSRKHQLA